MIRALCLALALLTAPAAAQPVLPAQAGIDEPHRAALMKALRQAGVEVGAVWPIGDQVYEVEEVRIERTRAGDVTVTVRTKLLNR